MLEFHPFADDTNLFLNNPNILNLESNLNVYVELEKVNQWFYAKKLSLNIEKKKKKFCSIPFSAKRNSSQVES